MQRLVRWFILFFLLLIISFPINTSAAQKRIALVIGNGAYKDSPLQNPVNDAHDMTQALKRMGFQVILKKNATLRGMHDALNRFSAKLKKGDVALFYYAGHGVQKEGVNYLLPVRNNIAAAADIRYEALPVGKVLGRMEEAGSLNVIILDACRNNPLGRGFSRSLERGLAVIPRKPAGSIIAYATAPGKTAADGHGRNGLFTSALLKHMETPDLDIYKMFSKVGKDVSRRSGGKQTPWSESSLYDDFYLASSGTVIETPLPRPDAQGRLSVSANVEGATVYVDGNNLGQTPLSGVKVSRGSHRVQVKKSGYDSYRTTIDIASGRSAALEAHLTPQTPQTARLYVNTTPDNAMVKILNIGPKFSQGMELQPGNYLVEVSAGDHDKQTRWVKLSEGEDKRLDIRLNELKKRETARYEGKRLDVQMKKISIALKDPIETITVNGVSFKMVRIPAGSFMMGSPTNEPWRSHREQQHRVTLTRDYYIGRTEVTQGLWRAVMGSNPSRFSSCGDDCPVERVSWDDCQAFIRKLNRLIDGGGFALPTEAQWEFAARAGTTTPFAFGSCLSTSQANYYGDYPFPGCSKGQYRKTTVKVASFAPNGWGLHDMHGNVWEWCKDWYDGSDRVIRGGGWSSYARLCRSANLGRFNPGFRDDSQGFRLVLLQNQ